MVVAGLTMDPASNAPIVILREKNNGRLLPIWIGIVEASAIAFELEHIKLTRPMTHDLLRHTIEELGGRVERVVIAELRDNTYYSVVVLSQNGRSINLDARPSDAIAIALRTKAPILCEGGVITQALAHADEAAKETTAAEASEEIDRGEGGPRPIIDTGDKPWREVLENLDPEAFGKYKM